MISHTHRVIYVHIQKTAGNSIGTAFGQPLSVPEKHFTARQLRQYYGDPYWKTYFKFAFVRNPWDRLVSWWSMIDAMRPHVARGGEVNKFQAFVLSHAQNFADFLTRCDADIEDSDGRKWIYRNQLDYITDENGEILVDFIGRFENLAEDFAHIAARAAAPVPPMPHENRSRRGSYVKYYSPQLADLVARRYERDIAYFGYTFGG